tara:strand:+ start:1402 stop:2697 length:1296 start_codon:yes stop_codon:yes gene_type:complete
MKKFSSRRIDKNSTVLFNSLGCKLNKYELEVMRSQAEKLGLIPLFKQNTADIVVINTCSVTNQAARDSRKMIRSYRRKNENAYIVVTGCYAQTDSETLDSLDIDLWLENHEKDNFFECIAPDIDEAHIKTVPEKSVLSSIKFQSRPFLKVQDGCNAFCSYCIIPRARGRSRSLDADTVIKQLQELIPNYPEVVLTGVNLGQYSDGTINLLELLKRAVDLPGLGRLRISSIEPVDLSPELLSFLVSHPKICNHLHIALQGAQNDLLKAMRRKYTIEEYTDRLHFIKQNNPEFCLGTDVIVGFPGENEACFEESLKNIKAMPLDYFHVFTFSSREKTVAQKLPNHIDGPTKKMRNRLMTELSNSRKESFLNKQVGRTLQVVVERERPAPGYSKGLSSNYVPVVFESQHDKSLEMVSVKVDEFHRNKVHAKLVT